MTPRNPRDEDRGYWLVTMPLLFWSGFGANSVIVYFFNLGGPAPLWLGIWGVTCTVVCGVLMFKGFRLLRRYDRNA